MKLFKLFFISTAIQMCCCTFGFSQNYGEFPIKEKYDRLSDLVVEPGFLNTCTNDISNCTGNRVGEFLSSQLRMYETTKDKGYLIKFINWCIEIQSLRNDITFPTNCIDGSIINGCDYPGWRNDSEEGFYEDGRTILPMAEFAYMVMHDIDLANTIIPQSLIDNTFGSFATYGSFANWLGQKVDETLIWYLVSGYWDDDKGFITDPLEDDDWRKNAYSINQLANISATLLYRGLSFPLGQANTNPYLNYRIKANIVGNLYKGGVDFLFDDGDCPHVGDIDIPGECFSLDDVLQTNTNNNSYWWYYGGWRVNRNNWHLACIFNTPRREKCSEYTKWIEDISHALSTLALPLAYYRTNYTGIFSNTDMIRWRNTFTKNIFDGSEGFNYGVNGNTSDISSDLIPKVNMIEYRYRPLGYMPFYKFDDAAGETPNVYNIIMDFYDNDFIKQSFQLHNLQGGDYLGLSETVAAQWDKECPDLTLYNRKVLYDQDFFAQNDLVVAPEQEDDYNELDEPAYADPITFTDNKFIIEDGVTVNMKAANKIILKSGFHAKAGSNFRAYIDPTIGCNGQKWSGHSTAQTSAYEPPVLPEEKTESDREEDPPIQKPTEIVMFPNPTTGQFTLLLLSEEEPGISVYVSDLLSNIVYQKENITSPYHTIDISSAPKGLYFVKIVSDNEVFVEKIIHQ